MKIRSSYISNSSSSSYIIEFESLEDFIIIDGETYSISSFINAIEMMTDYETEMKEYTYDDESRREFIIMLENMINISRDQVSITLKDIKLNVINNPQLNYAKFNLSDHNKTLNFLFNLLKK